MSGDFVPSLPGRATRKRVHVFTDDELAEHDRAVLAAVADHDGLADELRRHVRLGPWECACGGCHLYDGDREVRNDKHADHLADVVRAWLRDQT